VSLKMKKKSEISLGILFEV